MIKQGVTSLLRVFVCKATSVIGMVCWTLG